MQIFFCHDLSRSESGDIEQMLLHVRQKENIMKKMKLAGLATAVFMFAAMMTACGNAKATNVTTEQATEATTESAAETVTTTAAPETTVASTAAAETATDEAMRVGSLKGPTTMGLVNLMKASESGTSEGKYQFKMETQPDQILAGLVSGDLDVALIPANMASVAYNKTKHGVSVIDINTLGVLYIVSGDETIKNMKDLSGKTGRRMKPSQDTCCRCRQNALFGGNNALFYSDMIADVMLWPQLREYAGAFSFFV
jgi:hypothetical protein